jgi:hypothetical protein
MTKLEIYNRLNTACELVHEVRDRDCFSETDQSILWIVDDLLIEIRDRLSGKLPSSSDSVMLPHVKSEGSAKL